MPQNQQAEGAISGAAWSWPRLVARLSAVMALLVCAAIGMAYWEAVKPPPVGFGFYDPPSSPSLPGYFIFALLLSGAIASLWRGNAGILALGWMAAVGAFYIDLGLRTSSIVVFALIGLGLALAAWFSSRVSRST